jgi:hypothetical protein
MPDSSNGATSEAHPVAKPTNGASSYPLRLPQGVRNQQGHPLRKSQRTPRGSRRGTPRGSRPPRVVVRVVVRVALRGVRGETPPTVWVAMTFDCQHRQPCSAGSDEIMPKFPQPASHQWHDRPRRGCAADAEERQGASRFYVSRAMSRHRDNGQSAQRLVQSLTECLKLFLRGLEIPPQFLNLPLVCQVIPKESPQRLNDQSMLNEASRSNHFPQLLSISRKCFHGHVSFSWLHRHARAARIQCPQSRGRGGWSMNDRSATPAVATEPLLPENVSRVGSAPIVARTPAPRRWQPRTATIAAAPSKCPFGACLPWGSNGSFWAPPVSLASGSNQMTLFNRSIDSHAEKMNTK